MGPFEKFVRKTKTFKKIIGEYSRITERNFQIIKDQDAANDELQDRLRALGNRLDMKENELGELRKRFANIPDAAKHMAVVSECERLKFVNAELNDEIRAVRQELFDLKNPGILKPVTPKLTVKDVVVLETLPPVKKTKSLKSVKAAETKRRTVKTPKFARGTPRKRSR